MRIQGPRNAVLFLKTSGNNPGRVKRALQDNANVANSVAIGRTGLEELTQGHPVRKAQVIDEPA
jgi:hypothetical protein